jgi:protein-disulfide isomerase
MKTFFRSKRFTSLYLQVIGTLFIVVLLGACTLPITPPTASTENNSEQSSTPTKVPNEEAATTAPSASEAISPTQDTATTAAGAASANNGATETYKGIPVGFTDEGFPYRGSLDAPITMYEYSDYQCPFCSRYFVQTEPALDESYVRSGQVRVVFRDFPLVELHPNAPPAHVAALCVADQGAALYWAIHARLFQTQSEWNQLPDPATYFADLATEVGADSTQYQACVESGEKEPIVEARVAEAQAKGFSGTPSFQFMRDATTETFDLVGAQPYDQFAGMIDTLVAGGTPQTEAQAQPQGDNEIPLWATADGLKPDPDRPGLTMAGDFYRGNPDAKVVIIEFSDFQCPFCRKHTLETQPTLDEQFVATDQVLWVFKHFPLTIHPQAPAAGVASECAADQGKFWEMHHLLFDTLQSWSISDPTPVFVELAQQLALDVDQFTTCLGDATVAQRVQDDLAAGTPFVRGTPTFIVLYNGQGSIIPGALPAERFTTVIQEVLTGAGQ